MAARMSSPLYGPVGVPPGGRDFRPEGLEALLADLNPAQREAVTHLGAPLLIVAGAGTGKTRVLTRRVGWLIANGAPPASILAITFTNKAADVLVERLSGLPGGRGVFAGTFHAFGAWMLRRWADRIGGDRAFTILDSDDQSRLLRDLIRDVGLDPEVVRPDAVSDAISHHKCGAAGRVPAALRDERLRDALPELERRYEARLKASSLHDFDDLLVRPLRLLREVPEAAAAVRGRFRHVLVDEFQDTNGAQMDLVKALAEEEAGVRADVCVVGDPDQSIYRWRGATVRNILGFADEFPGTRVVTLEENYRSTQRVLAAAEAVIAVNRQRYDKRLRTANAEGERVLEVPCDTGEDEAAAVVSILSRWMSSGISPSDLAVFFRVNHVSRGIESALHAAGIPYAMVSGVAFWQRREVKDLLAYARLVENPRDDAAFSRVVNVPRRGVGQRSLEALRARATERGVSLAEAAALDVPGVSGKARTGLDALLACLARLRALPRAPVAPLIEAIADQTGYRSDLSGRDDPIESSRVENVDELVHAAALSDQERPEDGLRSFVERASLASEQDGWDARAERVSLMTVHAAKGLEFRGVVLVGAEDGWFPHARNANDADDVEEERRLFYVAMTRARERLALTHARLRFTYRRMEVREPSPFLACIPDDALAVTDRTGYPLSSRPRAGRGVLAPRRPVRPDAGLDPSADDGFVREAPDDGEAVYPRGRAERGGDDEAVPRPGERVLHPHFGPGRMVARSGQGPDLRVVVDFDGLGTKTILWTYARLTRMPGDAAGGRA